jgi:PhzF family phenazine biosynthesis protein
VRRANDDPRAFDVRYFAPSAEVAFCGHATIATGVALAERFGAGRYVLNTKVGAVPVEVVDHGGWFRATLTSTPPNLKELPDDALDALLRTLRWQRADLHPLFPPKVAYAGVWHPVIAVSDRTRLADLDYDFEALRALMLDNEWTTVQLAWRESPAVFHVRDPFPVGGVVEDPATGAAAAAFGHYLRELGLIEPPSTITLHQGDDLGRPSVLMVDVDSDDPRIRVSGRAVAIKNGT